MAPPPMHHQNHVTESLLHVLSKDFDWFYFSPHSLSNLIKSSLYLVIHKNSSTHTNDGFSWSPCVWNTVFHHWPSYQLMCTWLLKAAEGLSALFSVQVKDIFYLHFTGKSVRAHLHNPGDAGLRGQGVSSGGSPGLDHVKRWLNT